MCLIICKLYLNRANNSNKTTSDDDKAGKKIKQDTALQGWSGAGGGGGGSDQRRPLQAQGRTPADITCFPEACPFLVRKSDCTDRSPC